MTGDPGQRGDDLAMAFTAAEQAGPAGQPRGRLATVAPDGTRQNKPAGVPSQRRARCGRQLRLREGIAGGPSGVRFPEIGGWAEAVSRCPCPPASAVSSRIHPHRIIACSIRPGWAGLHARDMPVEEAGQ